MEQLRKSVSGWTVKILMGLLVLSFAATGMSGFFSGPSANVLVSVGKTTVSPEDFRTAFASLIQQESQRRNQQISLVQARQLGLDQQVLSQLITEALLTESARQMNFTVTDETVAKSIHDIDAFKNSNGQFSRERFDRFLQNANMTETQAVEQQRKSLLRQQLVQGLMFEKDAPQPLLEAVYAFQNETRALTFIKIDDAMLGALPAPEDAALEAFFNTRKTQFSLPELRSFVALHLDRATLEQQVSVSDEEVRTAYDANAARFTTPERRTVQRIPLANADDAKAVSESLANGKSFDDIVAERNLKDSDIALGTVNKDGIVDKKIADAAFELSLNDVSGIVEGQFSPAIVRVTAIEPEVVRSFDDVATELKQQLLTQRIAARLSQLYSEIDKQRASGASLKEITDSLGLPLLTFTKIAENGNDADGNSVSDLPEAAKVMPAVFESDVDVENDAIQLGASDYFWFEVTAVEDSRERTFEEAKSRALTAWEEDEKISRLDTRAKAITEKLVNGASFADAAQPLNVTPVSLENIARITGSSELGTNAISRIFATPVDGFGYAQGPERMERVIFKVTERNRPAFDAAALGPLAQQLAQSYESDVLDLYLEQQRLVLNPQINPQALAPLLGTELR